MSYQRQEIENMVHTNVLNIIQLQTPGFEIFDDIANGSDPNKIPDMVLRGRSSFIEGDQTNVPLFILDGTEVDISYVFDMPSDDIESISVLKDASASAIYGAKASAGVILVTTKKGAAGKATVSYSNNIGWTQPTTPTDFITNGYDYATIVNDLYFSRYAYNAFNYTDADWAALEARRYDTTEHPDRPWVVIGDAASTTTTATSTGTTASTTPTASIRSTTSRSRAAARTSTTTSAAATTSRTACWAAT